MTIPDDAVEAAVKAMHADDVEHGRAFLPLDEMDPMARESYYDNARAALTAAEPYWRAQELREFIEEADASPAVTWGWHGGIKELAIRRHNRIDAARLVAEGTEA